MIKRSLRAIKHTFQYITRGFSDAETWSLDWTIAKFVLPRLKRFKNVNNGVPHQLTQEAWDKILDDMIYAFDIVANQWSKDDPKVDWSRVDAGLELFAKHYRDLWW